MLLIVAMARLHYLLELVLQGAVRRSYFIGFLFDNSFPAWEMNQSSLQVQSKQPCRAQARQVSSRRSRN